MSERDPFPCPKFENDVTFSGFRPQQGKTFNKPTHLAQMEEPWSRLHDRPTVASMRRSALHYASEAPKDSLDFQLKSVYDQHKDFLSGKNQVFYQKETVPEDNRTQQPINKLEIVREQDDIRVWVDPQRRTIHNIK